MIWEKLSEEIDAHSGHDTWVEDAQMLEEQIVKLTARLAFAELCLDRCYNGECPVDVVAEYRESK